MPRGIGLTASAVQAAVQATGQVSGARAAVTSASGRQVLFQFTMKGDPDTAANRVQPVEDAVTRVQAGHRGVTIEEVGQASVPLAVGQCLLSSLGFS